MENIINYQTDISERIMKARINFKRSPKDRITKEYVEGRMDSVDLLWSEFFSGHKELMRTVSATDVKESYYSKNDLFDKTEEEYISYKCDLKTTYAKFITTEREQSNYNNDHSEVSSKSIQVRLPKINIPKFSGQYSEWSTFKDLFQSLIHTNDSLNDVQKLQYLKGYLMGEAELILRNVPILETNYLRCWKLLEERYDNKKYISHQILKRFLSQKSFTFESASGLKDLLDTTNDCLSTISNLGVDVNGWDILVIHILTLKLDPETRRQWEFNVASNSSSDELPTYEQFKEFITGRYRAIEFLDTRSNSIHRNQNTQNTQINNNSVNKFRALHATNMSCQFCSGDHKLSYCKLFTKETVDSRRKFVQDNNICFNCLGSNHFVKFCRTTVKCHMCSRKHHTLLHPKDSNLVITEATDDVNASDKEGSSNTCVATSSEGVASEPKDSIPFVSCLSTGKVFKQVLLATALVKAMSNNGTGYTIRALLDQGSQSSFVTESTVQYLGLKKIPISSETSGIGGGKNITEAMVTIQIQSLIDPKEVIMVKAYVLKSITSILPAMKVELSDWKELHELILADPDYHTPNRVDLLLGAEIYSQILQSGVKKGPLGSPVAQLTSLGWILSGTVNVFSDPPSDIKVMHCRGSDNELLKKFWELESNVQLPKEKLFTNEEIRCKEYFTESTSREPDGKYIVRLPLKDDNPEVAGSLQITEKRLMSLKYHLKRIIGSSTLTYEEMATVLAQIEACLNSRPLSVIKNDPESPLVLTPGLVGEALITAPDRNFENSNVGSLRRWQHTQKMLQDFWRQWSQEYLVKFLHRYKWSSQHPQPNLDDVVVVKEDGVLPSRWVYGRIIELHPGLDKIVRVVTLKTKNGTLKRPVSKLCLLPITK